MKYISEITHKTYDTEQECLKAEQEYEKKLALEKKEKEEKALARKAAAAEVEDARKAMLSAQNKYREVLEAFCKNYGAYHFSSKVDDFPSLLDSFFNSFFF